MRLCSGASIYHCQMHMELNFCMLSWAHRAGKEKAFASWQRSVHIKVPHAIVYSLTIFLHLKTELFLAHSLTHIYIGCRSVYCWQKKENLMYFSYLVLTDLPLICSAFCFTLVCMRKCVLVWLLAQASKSRNEGYAYWDHFLLKSGFLAGKLDSLVLAGKYLQWGCCRKVAKLFQGMFMSINRHTN